MIGRLVIHLSLLAFPQAQAPDRQQQIVTHARQAQQDLQSKRPDLAALEYEAILKLDPDNGDARANLGVAEFFAARYDKASDTLRTVLKQQPAQFKLQSLLGMSEKRNGESRSAQSDLETSFDHLEEDQKLRIQTGMELVEVDYSLNELGKAATVVNTLRQIKPDDPDILYAAHRVYSDLADETMLSLVMAAPDSARTHQVMAHELARRADREGAIRNYREALKTDPNRSDLHFELAEMLNGSSLPADRQAAEQEYQTALAHNPFDGKAECRLGEISVRKSNLKAAEEHYAKALRLEPDNVDANLGYAKVLMSLHELQRAEPPLQLAVKLEPFDPAAHYRLGVLYRELGQTTESRQQLAEFERLKKMKARLRTIYEEMRLQPKGSEPSDADAPQ